MLPDDGCVLHISILFLLVNFSVSKVMISDYLSFAQFVISMVFENYVEILLVFQVFQVHHNKRNLCYLYHLYRKCAFQLRKKFFYLTYQYENMSFGAGCFICIAKANFVLHCDMHKIHEK